MTIYRTTGRDSFRLEGLAANVSTLRKLGKPNGDYLLSAALKKLSDTVCYGSLSVSSCYRYYRAVNLEHGYRLMP